MTAAKNQITAQLPVVIVPGFHDAALTDGLVRSLPSFVRPMVCKAYPTSPLDIFEWLKGHFSLPNASSNQKNTGEATIPLVSISFSAGTVGLAGALALWQQQGGKVSRLIAVDGWGVPIVGLPVTRISHDKFTHATSVPLKFPWAAEDVNFYAEPAVPHLDLWASPESAVGLEVKGLQLGDGVPMNAGEFLRRSLHAEWNAAFSWRAVTY